MKVSVVVPIYNVAKYLKECLDTLVNQTAKNMEIILVDDGSTDNSPIICDEYASKYPDLVKCFHKRNGGLSDARNFGLKKSSGEYIVFIDSDDFVSTTMIEKLQSAIENNNVDIVVCGYQRVTSKKDFNVIAKSSSTYTRTGKEILYSIYSGGEKIDIDFVAWNKLYKKNLFIDNNIEYPKGKYHEDEYVTYKLLYFAKRIAVIPEELYYYRIREGSIMTSKISQKQNDLCEALEEAIVFFSDYRILYENALYRYLIELINLRNQNKNNVNEYNNYCIKYRETFSKYGPLKVSPMKRKLKLFLLSRARG